MKTLVSALPLAGRFPWAGWATGVVWLLVAASAVHWTLRLGVRGPALPPQAQTVGVAQALQGDPSRLFARASVAAAPAASPARDRFHVFGVAAQNGDGWALMSVDGKPARAYRRGAAVDGQWQVLSVAQRRIDVGPAGGPAAVSLDLPALPAAATGRLVRAADRPGLPPPPPVGALAPAGPGVPGPGAPVPDTEQAPPNAIAR